MISVRSNWPVSLRIDAEIGGKLHRAAHALGHIDERAVGEDRRIQRREEIVGHRHDRAQIFPHQLGMIADRFGDRAEDHARFAELLLERRRDRHGIEHRVDRHAGQELLLVQRNAELLVGLQQLRIDFVEARWASPSSSAPRSNRRSDNRSWDNARAPSSALSISRQRRKAASRHSSIHSGSSFLGRDEAHDVFVEALGARLHLDVGDEAVFVLLARAATVCFWFRRAADMVSSPTPRRANGRAQTSLSRDASIASDICVCRIPAEAHAQRASSQVLRATPIAVSTCDGADLARGTGGARTHAHAVEIERHQRGLRGDAGDARNWTCCARRGAFAPKIDGFAASGA